MAGELSNAMHEVAASALALNSKALNYIADAFATEDYIDLTKWSFDDMYEVFDSHGHGNDLRYCQDEFCLQAKNVINTIVAEQTQAIQSSLLQSQGGR
jgi:hypothetical protein